MYPHLNIPELVHIHQKKKITPKIAAKFASVNGPLQELNLFYADTHWLLLLFL